MCKLLINNFRFFFVSLVINKCFIRRNGSYFFFENLLSFVRLGEIGGEVFS